MLGCPTESLLRAGSDLTRGGFASVVFTTLASGCCLQAAATCAKEFKRVRPLKNGQFCVTTLLHAASKRFATPGFWHAVMRALADICWARAPGQVMVLVRQLHGRKGFGARRHTQVGLASRVACMFSMSFPQALD